MGARSRRKGNTCERRVARLLENAIGGTWSRVPQSGGWANRAAFSTCGDVVTTVKGFPFTIECKHVEGWHLEQLLVSPDTCPIACWWRQAKTEASEAKRRPMLVFTRNFQPLYVMTRVVDRSAAGLPEAATQLVVRTDEDEVTVALLASLIPGLVRLYGTQHQGADGTTRGTE